MIRIFAKDSSPNDSIPAFIWRRIFGKDYNHSKYSHQINLSSFHLAKNRISIYLFFSSLLREIRKFFDDFIFRKFLLDSFGEDFLIKKLIIQSIFAK